jgi:hypothetical protein
VCAKMPSKYNAHHQQPQSTTLIHLLVALMLTIARVVTACCVPARRLLPLLRCVPSGGTFASRA